MAEYDKHGLVDPSGLHIPWRNFFGLLVAANHDPETHRITGIQLLVGYQTKPGVARIQATGAGLREMLSRGEGISTAHYDETTENWIVGTTVKILSNGRVCTGNAKLPTFEWVDSPSQRRSSAE